MINKTPTISAIDWRRILFVFDIDGTLTDTTKIDDRCFIEAFEEKYDWDLGTVDWSDFEHVTDTGLSRELLMKMEGRKISKAELDDLQKVFFTKIDQALTSIKDGNIGVSGAVDFLNHLKSLNAPIAMATGGWRKSAELKLEYASIPYEPFTLATSNDNFKRRSIINIAIARAQFHYQQYFSKIVFFGDGIWDARTCEAMEIPMIGLDIHESNQLQNHPHVCRVFHGFNNIKEILNVTSQLIELSESSIEKQKLS